MPDQTAKRNAALVAAFEELARSLGVAVRLDTTSNEYDSLAVGNRALKNALSIWETSTSFFTTDPSLLDDLTAAGFACKPAPFRSPSPHNRFRYRTGDIAPSSLVGHSDLFNRVVKDSVAYVEQPIAGHRAR